MTAFGAIALFSAIVLGQAPDEPAARPNVVLVMTDDQGFGDLGANGNSAIRTPQLDTLTATSANFEWFYVSPVCLPTRASLLTGRYHYRTRVSQTSRGLAMMDPGEFTLAEALGSAGYATSIFGKWHLGDSYPLRAMDQGFDESLVHSGALLSNEDRVGAYTDPELLHNGRAQKYEGYCTDVFFDAAIRWIEAMHTAKSPFFCYIPTNVPHVPLGDPPAQLFGEYLDSMRERAATNSDPSSAQDHATRVYAMLTHVDQNVGKLLGALRSLGIEQDTLLIFLSDNGPIGPRYSAGLRGDKATVFENGIRVPSFIRWPGRIKPQGITEVAAHIDLMPTILELCGLPQPAQRIDGQSLVPLLGAGERQRDQWPQRSLFIQHHRGNVPVRYRNMAVRTQDWKLVHAVPTGDAFESPPKCSLYDLRTDPGEQHDLAAQHPARVTQMLQAYGTWFDDVSRTRQDNFAPPAMHLGSAHQNPVELSAQARLRSPGRWKVRVVGTGSYSLSASIPSSLSGRLQAAVLTIGEQSWRTQLTPKATGVSIEKIHLPLGDASLSLRFETKAKSISATSLQVLHHKQR